MQTLLQEYTRPVGEHAEAIRIEWTPHFRAFHLCRNLNLFDDETLPIPQRYSSFDANTKECLREKVSSPSLLNSLEKLGAAIATHVWQVSGETTRVSLMTLFVQRTEVFDPITGKPSVILKLQYCTRLKTRRMNSAQQPGPEAPLSQSKSAKKHKEVYFSAFKGRGQSNSKQILETVRLGKLEDEDTVKVVEKIGRHCTVCLARVGSHGYRVQLGEFMRWKEAQKPEVAQEFYEMRRRKKVKEEGRAQKEDEIDDIAKTQEMENNNEEGRNCTD